MCSNYDLNEFVASNSPLVAQLEEHMTVASNSDLFRFVLQNYNFIELNSSEGNRAHEKIVLI